MNLAERGVAGVPLLGRYNYASARSALSEHVHEDAIEICFLVKGRQTYRLRGETYRLNGGDVFMTLPKERHGTGGFPEEKGVLYWLWIAAPSRGERLLGLPRGQDQALLNALQGGDSRHFRGSWEMKEHLDEITSLYFQPATPLNTFAMANRVGAFLGNVIACAGKAPARGGSRSLEPIAQYIDANLGEPLPIPHLAARAGLSVARFKAWFKQEAGVPPGEYVLRAKIEEAQRRLARRKASVTEIAYDLGFSTSQYFSTVFKRFTGETPSDFRKGRYGFVVTSRT